jgi:hypothetical protein
MKNIMIVDSAANCTYSVYQATELEFGLIFPKSGQDIQFHDEMRKGKKIIMALSEIWKRPILKKNALGIHGVIFYGHPEKKEYLPESRRSIDMNRSYVNPYEAEIFQNECEAISKAATNLER